MKNISLQSSGMRRKQNFEIVFGSKSDTAVLTFTFRFLSSLLFSLFLPHFFSLAGHLVGFILVGRVFRKAFRILGLDERKGRWVLEQDFSWKFSGQCYMVFCLFSCVLDWIMLILVWFERTLHSLKVSRQSYPGQSKLMTSQAVERTWICTSCYRWFRGERVNFSILLFITELYTYIVWDARWNSGTICTDILFRAKFRVCTDFWIQNSRLFPDFFPKTITISFSRLKVIT